MFIVYKSVSYDLEILISLFPYFLRVLMLLMFKNQTRIIGIQKKFTSDSLRHLAYIEQKRTETLKFVLIVLRMLLALYQNMCYLRC